MHSRLENFLDGLLLGLQLKPELTREVAEVSNRREISSKTNKSCPDCGNTHLGLVSTQNEKHCVDCGKKITWLLEPGQKPRF